MFDFDRAITKKRLAEFADFLIAIQSGLDMKISSRGWCYMLEPYGLNKSHFDKIEDAVNRCRKEGLLPVDFVAEETKRAFSGVEKPSEGGVKSTLAWMLDDVLTGHRHFTPDWLAGEDYCIQVLVEKIDLKTLFAPVCEEYHIPIANSSGWSSILQRAEYARRFAEAQQQGLKCVLLYCGDYDPDGLRISNTIQKNLTQISDVIWEDGFQGFDPEDLIIERFGLNYDFIVQNDYSWIDNLITGSGKNLANPDHENYNLPYVQDYLRTVGVRKCEANAVVTTPEAARQLMRNTIESFLGLDAKKRFALKKMMIRDEYQYELERLGIVATVKSAIRHLDAEN